MLFFYLLLHSGTHKSVQCAQLHTFFILHFEHEKRLFQKLRITCLCLFLSVFLVLSHTHTMAQRTRGLSSAYQSNFLRSHHKFLNLEQIASSEFRPSINFKTSTKHQHITSQNFKILAKLSSESRPRLDFIH